MENIYFEYEENEGIKADSIYLNHKELLDEMAESGTVAIDKSEEGAYYFRECCDGYYSFCLTKEKCAELSQIFKEIADKL